MRGRVKTASSEHLGFFSPTPLAELSRPEIQFFFHEFPILLGSGRFGLDTANVDTQADVFLPAVLRLAGEIHG